jgi:hypothetical protein
MKKLLLIPLLLLSLSLGAQTKWYVATTGSDSHGKGTLADPWLTLKHACDTVTGANFYTDTIIVGAGTYSETAQSSVGVKINIKNETGTTPIITTATNLNPILLLASASEGTDGSQSISGLYFDGNDTTALSAIRVVARSNVKVQNCTFRDFDDYAITFTGVVSGDKAPVIFSTGNRIENCTIINCSEDNFSGIYIATGCIQISGQSGPYIGYNTIDNTGSYGYGIKYSNNGYNHGMLIEYNDIKVFARGVAGSWAFSIELWSQRGGITIRHNTLQGSIDLGGYDTNDSIGYGFAALIEDNVLGNTELKSYNTYGINVELGQTGGLIIRQNHFKNVSTAIEFNTTTNDTFAGMEDITVSYNVFENITTTAGGYTGYVATFSAAGDYAPANGFDDISFLNNVNYCYDNGQHSFINVEDNLLTFTDFKVRNNIIVGAYNGIKFDYGTISRINVDNNIFYNVHSGTKYVTGQTTVSDSTFSNNLTSDPLFRSTSNFRLQSTSPAINAGISVGLTSDYAGHRIPQGALPDIGAYEYGNYLVLTPSGHLLRNANGKFMIIH